MPTAWARRAWSSLRGSRKWPCARLCPPYGLLRFCFLERVDHIAGLVFGRSEHRLRVHAAELVELAALDVVILHLQHSALLPLPAFAELHVAHDRLERGLVNVVGEGIVLQALGR